jgi:hypothetical protein
VVTWRLVFTKHARKDAKKIARAGLKPQVEHLLEILKKILTRVLRHTRSCREISPAHVPAGSLSSTGLFTRFWMISKR